MIGKVALDDGMVSLTGTVRKDLSVDDERGAVTYEVEIDGQVDACSRKV